MKYIFLINAVVIVDLFPNAGPEFTRLDMCHMKALVPRCVCAERICGRHLRTSDCLQCSARGGQLTLVNLAHEFGERQM